MTSNHQLAVTSLLALAAITLVRPLENHRDAPEHNRRVAPGAQSLAPQVPKGVTAHTWGADRLSGPAEDAARGWHVGQRRTTSFPKVIPQDSSPALTRTPFGGQDY